LVSLPDRSPTPKADVVDLGFSNEDAEIRVIRFVAGDVYLVDRFTSSAEFMVHKGSETGGPWVQIGQKMVETPADMWTDGQEVVLLVNRADIVGLDCRRLPVTAGPLDSWQTCASFPDYAKEGPNEFYSIFGKFLSDGSPALAWFEVRGDVEDTIALHSMTSAWSLLWQDVMVRPASWTFDGVRVYFGFVGTDAGSPLLALEADGTWAQYSVEGLPAAKDKLSGVVGLCHVQERLFALYLDHYSTDSSISVYSSR